MTNEVIGAFGIVDLSPFQVSNVLKQLRVSHTYVGLNTKTKRTAIIEVPGNNGEQPAWPVVIDRVSAIKRVQTPRQRLIYLITDSRAALSVTNASHGLWPEQRENLSFDKMLRLVLQSTTARSEPFAFKKAEPSIADYVNAATKPSFLNHIQTAIYKIQPYPMRKEVQAMCIAYLAGGVSHAILRRKLKSSFKLDELAALMLADKAKSLRDAVSLLKGAPVDQVAKKTGFEPFELNYVANSYARNRK